MKDKYEVVHLRTHLLITALHSLPFRSDFSEVRFPPPSSGITILVADVGTDRDPVSSDLPHSTQGNADENGISPDY